MLIIPLLNRDRSLFLDAYSYQMSEIKSLTFVLSKIVEQFDVINLERDRSDRMGMRHAIAPYDVPRVEERLGIQFQGEGPTTSMIIKPPGTGYRCKEISARGSGTGCLNMSAADQADALVKCAFLARYNYWFGGEAEPGDCLTQMGKLLQQVERRLKK